MRRGDADEIPWFGSGKRVLAGAGCFTLGAGLLVAGSTLVLHLVVEGGRGLVGSERLRSVLALVAFGATIAIPVTLLVIATTGSDDERDTIKTE
jgi:hypothetical protein